MRSSPTRDTRSCARRRARTSPASGGCSSSGSPTRNCRRSRSCSAACREPSPTAPARSTDGSMAVDGHTPVTTGRSIDAATALGTVSLTVADLPRARAFYEDVVGLVGSAANGGGLLMGDAAGHPLVALHEDRAAPPLNTSGNGLFHLALLVPDRRE